MLVTSDQIDLRGVVAHTVKLLAVELWPLWLLLGLIALGKGAFWIIEQRRIARSGITEIDRMDGATFEQRMAVLFRDLGYRVQRTRQRGDYGADLVVERNGQKLVVQAKRWTKPVGVKAVQEAAAAKPLYGCSGALVVTNSRFTQQARKLAAANHVDLWDREHLVRRLTASAL